MNGSGMSLGANVPTVKQSRTITEEIDYIGSLAYSLIGQLDELDVKIYGNTTVLPDRPEPCEHYGIKSKVGEIKSMLEEANKRMADIRERL